MDASRLCLCIHPGRPADQFLVNPGDLLYFFQGIVFDPFFKSIPAVDVIIRKLSVVKLFFKDHAVKSHGQGRIRARTKLQPQIRFFRRESFAWIDADQLSPFFVRIPKAGSLVFVRVGPLGIAAPQNNTFGTAGIIANGEITHGDQCGGHPRDVTHVPGSKHVGGT